MNDIYSRNRKIFQTRTVSYSFRYFNEMGINSNDLESFTLANLWRNQMILWLIEVKSFQMETFDITSMFISRKDAFISYIVD